MKPPQSIDVPCGHTELTPGCQLLHELSLRPAEGAAWLGRCRAGRARADRAFGGHVAAQALLAAAATVPPGRSPHSLHVNFLAGVSTEADVRYSVAILRDGGSFSVRQVVASQGRQSCSVVTASFHDAPGSTEREHVLPFTEPTEDAVSGAKRDTHPMMSGLAYLTLAWVEDDGACTPRRRSWMRIEHPLPEDPVWNAALLTFMSDIGMSRTVTLPHAKEPGRLREASLDHNVWYHRAGRADQWMQYEQTSPVYRAGRGMCMGEIRGNAGWVLASTAQEVAVDHRLRRVLDI